MNITQQLCCPGAAENQDYIRLGEDIAMVVDGSTPLVKDPRVPEVREYVRLLVDAVVGAEGEDLPHMVAAGIETLRRRWRSSGRRGSRWRYSCWGTVPPGCASGTGVGRSWCPRRR